MIFETFKTIMGLGSLVPFIWGVLLFRKSQCSIKYLTILMGMAVATEVTLRVLAARAISNHFLFHFYPIVELTLLYAIYRVHLKPIKIRRALTLIAVLFLAFSVLNILFLQKLNQFNTYGRATESLLLTILAIAYFFWKIQKVETAEPNEKPMFWINSAILLYFPLNLFFILMNNYLYQHYSLSVNSFIWNVHAFLSFTQYILFTIAIYTEWKRTKSPVLS